MQLSREVVLDYKPFEKGFQLYVMSDSLREGFHIVVSIKEPESLYVEESSE